MAQISVPLAVRRARRQRRLSRLQTQITTRTPTFLLRNGRAVAGMALVLAVTAASLVARMAPPEAIPAEAEIEYIGYLPDELRPDLEGVDETNMPMPAAYIVEEDDTLLAIALRFGSSAEAIRVASGLNDADFLRIGQSLTIPPPRAILQQVDAEQTLLDLVAATGTSADIIATYNGLSLDVLDAPTGRELVVLPPTQRVAPRAGTPVVAEVDATVYAVEPGDTLSEIAEKLGVEPRALIMANRLFRPDHLVVGDQLKLPGWSSTASEEAVDDRPRAAVVYEVAPGDTIGDLALQFGVDPETIIIQNDLPSADRIHVGDQLTILPVSGLMYTIRPGDTLADIAETYKVDLGPIIDFNYLERLDYLPVGKELLLPGARPLPRITLPATYTVRPGDTVSGIARRFGVDGDDVIAANNLRSADRIVDGSDLRIVPGAAAAARAAQNRSAAPSTTVRAASVSQQQVTVNRAVPAPAPPSAPTRQSVSGGGGGIASLGMQYLGYRYVFGGTTPSGFDCSGFVYYVYNRAGHGISRGMWGQYGAGSHPSRAELQPGDIVFFQNTYMAGLSHNGIYIGNGQFVHASDERNGVKVSSLSESYWASRWFGATRAW